MQIPCLMDEQTRMNLRESWIARGSPACKHDYLIGSEAAPWVCTSCGGAFSSEERTHLWEGLLSV